MTDRSSSAARHAFARRNRRYGRRARSPTRRDRERRQIVGVAPLDAAGPHDLAFMDNAEIRRRAGRDARRRLPRGPPVRGRKFPPRPSRWSRRQPYRAFAQVLARLFPSAARPGSSLRRRRASRRLASFILTARLEHGVGGRSGRRHRPARRDRRRERSSAPNAVIGPHVRIGRDCSIGPNASDAERADRQPRHHPSRRAASGRTASASPWARKAISRCRRSAGSSSRTTSRSAPTPRSTAARSRDTVIGEGTKIDNLVQIGHNVVIGRHCVIVAQVGISGSTTLGDFVVARRPGRRRRACPDRRRARRSPRSSNVNERRAGRRALGRNAGPARCATGSAR